MALGFYFDSNKCIGCRTCHLACKDLHGLGLGSTFRKVRAFEVGTYPETDGFRYSSSCNHCENATCIKSCSTGAIFRDNDGTVQLNADICIGCKKCMANCPFDAINIVAHSTNKRRIVGKCDSCKALRDAGKNPICVDSCLMRCLDFGELDKLKQKYGLSGIAKISQLPALASVKNISDNLPQVLIKVKPCALNSNFREVDI